MELMPAAAADADFCAQGMLGSRAATTQAHAWLTAAAKYLQESTMYLIQVYPLAEEQVRHTGQGSDVR